MKHLIIILILLILISCTQTTNTPELDKEQTIKEVSAMLDEYHEAMRTEGFYGEFKYLDNSPDFFWVPPGFNSALSYDSVKTILEANANVFRSIEFHWDTLQLFPLTNEIVNYSGIVGGIMIDTAGVTSNVSIIESGTLIKRKDGWKLLSGQSAVLHSNPDN